MSGQQQQQQRLPPQDSKQASHDGLTIESNNAKVGGSAATDTLPPPQRQQRLPAAGPVRHGFTQPMKASIPVVPNPLGSAAAQLHRGQPAYRFQAYPGRNNNIRRPLPAAAAPPIVMPPIPAHDPKEMEERRKKALAYAMSTEITGGAKGRKRHAAKLAAERKKAAALAAKVKGNIGVVSQQTKTPTDMPTVNKMNYKQASTNNTATLPKSNNAKPSAVANPLAPPITAPRPPPTQATTFVTNPNTPTRYLPMYPGGTSPANSNGAGWPRKLQVPTTNAPPNDPSPKRGRPRKIVDSNTPQTSDKNKLPISLLAEAASTSPSADVPNNDVFAPLPFEKTYDDESMYDPEYARFMRSLMADDQSILTFRTLQSIRTVGGGIEGPPLGTIVGDGSMMGFGTADEDDASYQLTSDEDEEEDDEDDDEEDHDNGEDVEKDSNNESKEVSEMKVDTPARTRSNRKARELESSTSPEESKPPLVDDDDLGIFHEEIEGLMEEDLEAAVASLIGVSPEGEFSSSSWQLGNAPPTGKNAAMAGTEEAQAITTPGQSTKRKKSTATIVTSTTPVSVSAKSESNAPSSNSRTSREPPVVTQEQLLRLRATMARHHQLLLQQATLAVRAAYVQKVSGKPGKPSAQNRSAGVLTDKGQPPSQSPCSYPNDFFAGETAEELSDCLDGSVSMLQDLEQHWKDAVRNSIQLAFRETADHTARRKLLQSFGYAQPSSSSKETGADDKAETSNQSNENKRLTRSAFTRTLIERELDAEPCSGQFKPPTRQRVSVFEIRGLARLRETFTAIDNSVKDIYIGGDKKRIKRGVNILAPFFHSHACKTLLEHAKADIDPDFVPGQVDLYNILTHAPEAFGNVTKGQEPSKIKCPLAKTHRLELRQNRNQFTAAEDNLILRGVNLYGEKEWVLVSDRFLPDRQVNHISQRYNRLCFLIYKANGVSINDKGELPPLPKTGKSGNYNEEKANEITPAEAPTTMNVHRWSLEEDLVILKAVPVFGSCWADISSRLIPHRDRGHIRKRYQVLERRIPKGVCKVNMKRMFSNRSPPTRPPKKLKTSSSVPKKSTPTKSTAFSHPVLPPMQLTAARPSIDTPMSPIKSSIQSSNALAAGQHRVGKVKECYSPETKGAAALLGVFSGFSQESQHAEDTRMGVLKILEIADGKMADSNFSEGNFGKGDTPRSPMKSRGDLLDDRTSQKARTSILNSVLDNVRRKDDKDDFHCSTPSKVDFNSYLSTADTPSRTALPDEAFPTKEFNLGTPSKEESKSQASMDGKEFVRLFMSDNNHQTPMGSRFDSPVKANTTMGTNFSPIKLGNMAPPTPITNLGSLGFSGPVDGLNSLFMGASDLDAVAALKDLSNSNPGTPAKETAPAVAMAATTTREEEASNERKCTRPKTSFFGQVQANVDKRKFG